MFVDAQPARPAADAGERALELTALARAGAEVADEGVRVSGEDGEHTRLDPAIALSRG